MLSEDVDDRGCEDETSANAELLACRLEYWNGKDANQKGGNDVDEDDGLVALDLAVGSGVDAGVGNEGIETRQGLELIAEGEDGGEGCHVELPDLNNAGTCAART